MSRKGGRGGAYQAGVDAALRAVAAQLKGRAPGRASGGAPGGGSAPGRRRQSYGMGEPIGPTYGEDDFGSGRTRPVRIGWRG